MAQSSLSRWNLIVWAGFLAFFIFYDSAGFSVQTEVRAERGYCLSDLEIGGPNAGDRYFWEEEQERGGLWPFKGH